MLVQAFLSPRRPSARAASPAAMHPARCADPAVEVPCQCVLPAVPQLGFYPPLALVEEVDAGTKEQCDEGEEDEVVVEDAGFAVGVFVAGRA